MEKPTLASINNQEQPKAEVEAEVFDVVSKIENDDQWYKIITRGGLKIPIYDLKDINLAVLKPVTTVGTKKLDRYVEQYKELSNLWGGKQKTHSPVTTLAVEAPPAAGGGKRNKSKKLKRRNSRSKRSKTVSKRRH